MLNIAERKMQIFRLFLFALACATLYHMLIERQASVVMEVQTSAPTNFKIYWLNTSGELWSEQKSRRIQLRPEQPYYFFKLTDLSRVTAFRIDPSEAMAQVTIRSITITQNGYAPIRLAGGEALSRIKLGDGIDSMFINDEGLVITPANKDPQLFFDLPGALVKTAVLWSGEFLPLATVFLFVFFVGLGLERFITEDNTLIPVFVAVVLTLVTVMAGITNFNAHPDEIVHVRASDYFQHHILPPQVGAEEIKDTYSVYGVSRLHSGEIAYLFLGRFANAFHGLAVPSFMAQRYFNIVLWSFLLALALTYKDFRLILVPTLLSPQVWYIFSYVNAEAFAVFVMLLAAYQVASPHSAWNKLLDNCGLAATKPRWYTFACLGVLVALLFLVKKNFYFFYLYLGLYFLWRLLFGHTRLNRQNFRRIMVVALIGMAIVAGVWGTDAYINGFKKGEKLLQARYQFAGELWNPATPLEKRHMHLQMRERGTDLKRFLTMDKWGAKSFASAVGMYGYTSVSATHTYYTLFKYMGLVFLAAVTATALLRGGLEGITLWMLTASCAAGLIAFALYIAWTVDFQPQGRYFLPIVGMMSIFFLHGQRYLLRSVVPLICIGLFLMSLYSFIFVGLAGLLKPL